MNYKRGEVILKILDLLHDVAMSQVDFAEAMLRAGYGASMGKLDYEYNKIQKRRTKSKIEKADMMARKRRLALYVSKLKREGLIEVSNKGQYFISKSGLKKLSFLKEKLPGKSYEVVKQKGPIIVSFDIPERLRKKRNWLREVLRNLDFKIIHQSVWLGNTAIPNDFLEDLEEMKILEFVEIFEVSKTGTLKKLT